MMIVVGYAKIQKAKKAKGLNQKFRVLSYSRGELVAAVENANGNRVRDSLLVLNRCSRKRKR